MVENGSIYQPMARPPERAYMLLRSILLLADCDLAVRIPNWWKKRPRPGVGVVIGEPSRPHRSQPGHHPPRGIPARQKQPAGTFFGSPARTACIGNGQMSQ